MDIKKEISILHNQLVQGYYDIKKSLYFLWTEAESSKAWDDKFLFVVQCVFCIFSFFIFSASVDAYQSGHGGLSYGLFLIGSCFFLGSFVPIICTTDYSQHCSTKQYNKALKYIQKNHRIKSFAKGILGNSNTISIDQFYQIKEKHRWFKSRYESMQFKKNRAADKKSAKRSVFSELST